MVQPPGRDGARAARDGNGRAAGMRLISTGPRARSLQWCTVSTPIATCPQGSARGTSMPSRAHSSAGKVSSGWLA